MSHSKNFRPSAPRKFSSHLRHYTWGTATSRQNGGYGTMSPHPEGRGHAESEAEHLLEQQHASDDHADSDGLYPPHCCWTADCHDAPARADPFGNRNWPVYQNIHRIQREICSSIDDTYSMDQLKAPRMNISVIRPLVDQFYNTGDLSIVYCLLVNRTQFIREQSYATHHQTVNLTRALVCEIIAEKVLRRYNEHNPGPKGLLKLANILVAGFEPFQHAPPEVMQHNENAQRLQQGTGHQINRNLTALEIAIVSESKSFLATAACQKVVDAIYRGKIVYTPNSFIDILPDHWKRRPISLYDPRRGPLLNQYRLAVPRTRNVIEIAQFFVLLVLYLVVMQQRESRSSVAYRPIEAVFDVYAAGWILDQLATVLEHGWTVYTQNLWVFLDVMFSGIFVAYLATRIRSCVSSDHDQAMHLARLALDILSCGGPVLIPRLAFNVMSENMVFLCMRSMMSDFFTLVLLATWCFVGFLFSLKWLNNGIHGEVTIGEWMIWIWFGLDGTGIDRAAEFHPILGPALMIMFAFLGNTLFLTILVSMLSNTFSRISANALQEISYRRAVLTFQGVKSDAIFSYLPPLNILALLIMLPLKLMLSPRWFHKLNVGIVKVADAPILLIIGLYERRVLWISNREKDQRPKKIDWANPNGPRLLNGGWWSRSFQFWDFSKFSAHSDVFAVFEDPPKGLLPEDENGQHDGIGRTLRDDFVGQFSDPMQQPKARSLSMAITDVRSHKKSLSSKDPVNREFGCSDEEGDDESDTPHRAAKPKRPSRKDSLIDFDNDNVNLQEANARLQKIEALLLELVNSDEPSKEQEAVNEDVDSDLQE